MEPNRPRVSREMRRLLTVVLVSIAALWVLARIRFPDQPATPNPVPPVLAQLTPLSAFDDMAATLAQLQPRLGGSLVLLIPNGWSPTRAGEAAIALRYRGDLAVALLPSSAASAVGGDAPQKELARDAASQLTVLQIGDGVVAPVQTWSPRAAESPRFLIAAEPSPAGPSLRPVFIGTFLSTPSVIWGGPVWTPGSLDLIRPGSFLFTTRGDFAGLAIAHDGRTAIVPAALVVAAADDLLRQGRRPPGRVGVDVQLATTEVAAAAGTRPGAIVVTWVDPQGPAAGQIAVFDVVEELDGSVATLERWNARVARLAEGDSLSCTVRRRGEVVAIQLIAGAVAAPAGPATLGLTLRTVRGVGVEVLRIDPESAAAHAGMRAGDIITAAGAAAAPTPGQLSRAYATATDASPLAVAVTRGDAHLVLALPKTW
jgi:hypothetical protein